MKSLEKGIRTLELMSCDGTLRVAEVADILGINRISAHRYLSTLCDLGYVEKKGRGSYEVTYKVVELATKVTDRISIVKVVKPHLQGLCAMFNEAINLGYWNGREVIHIDKVESSEILRIDSPLGSAAPAYCTGLGKAILAYLPDEDLERYLAETNLERHGPNTITSSSKLREELEMTRDRGFAIDNEELVPMLCCVAAPLFDHTRRVRYAVSVSGPTSRMVPGKIERIKSKLTEVAARISVQVGGCDPGIRNGKGDHNQEEGRNAKEKA